jgi:hypothetical protein
MHSSQSAQCDLQQTQQEQQGTQQTTAAAAAAAAAGILEAHEAGNRGQQYSAPAGSVQHHYWLESKVICRMLAAAEAVRPNVRSERCRAYLLED